MTRRQRFVQPLGIRETCDVNDCGKRGLPGVDFHRDCSGPGSPGFTRTMPECDIRSTLVACEGCDITRGLLLLVPGGFRSARGQILHFSLERPMMAARRRSEAVKVFPAFGIWYAGARMRWVVDRGKGFRVWRDFESRQRGVCGGTCAAGCRWRWWPPGCSCHAGRACPPATVRHLSICRMRNGSRCASSRGSCTWIDRST